jgi:hypothetical protein
VNVVNGTSRNKLQARPAYSEGSCSVASGCAVLRDTSRTASRKTLGNADEAVLGMSGTGALSDANHHQESDLAAEVEAASCRLGQRVPWYQINKI